jgi:predicted nucleic acid-binding Zn ribbon protein
MPNCDFCGGPIPLDSKRLKYCSEGCATDASNERRRKPVAEKVCSRDECENPVPPKRVGYCSEECRRLAANEKRRRPPLDPKECRFCHESFVPKYHNQNYCSPEHKTAYESGQRSTGFMATPAKCERCGNKYMRKSPTQKYCGECPEEEFDPEAYAEQVDPIKREKTRIKAEADKSAYKAWLKGESKEELLLEKFREAVESYPPREDHRLWTPHHHPTHAREHAVLVVADAHVGEEVDPADTGGLGEYGLDIFADRLRHGFATAADIATNIIRPAGIPLDDLHQVFMGDMATGEFVYGSQPFHIDTSLEDQIVIGADLTARATMSLADCFKRTTVVGVKGNHGEHRPGSAKKKSKTNFDHLFYDAMQQRLSRQNDIQVINPRPWWYIHTINHWDFLLQHKNQGQSSLGTPYYAMDRDAGNMRNLLMNLKKHFYYYLVAHWHHEEQAELTYGERIVCPSMVGGTAFSTEELRKTGLPKMLFFGVSEKYGITWKYSIRLDMIPDDLRTGAGLVWTCGDCGRAGHGVPTVKRGTQPICIDCAEAWHEQSA